MSEMFNSSKFNGDISQWDVSNVTNMSFMFNGSAFSNNQFNGDISKWDVSNVTNMRAMFYHSQFNGDISQWDVSQVRDVSAMFHSSKFNGDISKWDTGNIKNMNGMFEWSKFSGNISTWDVSNVKSMSNIFNMSCFTGDISKWLVKPDCYLRLLIGYEIKQQGNNANLNNIDFGNYTNLKDLFRHFKDFNGDISKWDVSKVTNMEGMFISSKFNGDISDLANINMI